MLEESLLKSNFIGKDGFIWWIGRVADPRVWKRENIVMSQEESMGQRCKVRIIGYHPFTDELPEKDLPWAQVMMDAVTGSGQGGMGDTLTLVGGETALGFFLDGEEAQQPVIIGLLNRHNSVRNSISADELAQGQSSQMKPFTGGNLGKPTKTKRVETEDVAPPNSAAVQGKIKRNENSNTEQGVIQPKGNSSAAAQSFEKDNTVEQQIPSTCGNDAIGRLTQVITDFITVTNSLESSLGKFVDPISNAIVDMDTEIKKVVRTSKGVIKSIINNIRDGLFGKLTTIFSTFLGKLNLANPLDYISDAVANKAFQKVLDIIFCLFEKLLGDLTGFLNNLFKSLLGRIINGPFCAVEQFVSGIFSKIFSMLEDLLAPILDGLDWLTGGIGAIQGFLRKASNLATAIFNFIGCDGKKCSTPSKWASSTKASLKTATDDWATQVENINFLDGVASDLAQFGRDANGEIDDFFGTDEFKDTEYNGMRIGSVLEATDAITGGDSAGQLDKALGSIESAIATTPLFGGNNSVFDACNRKVTDPQNQDDIIRMPLGYRYEKCIPPEVRINGSGSGARAIPIVDRGSSILAVKMVRGGSGYDNQTTAIILDNTNIGYGAELKPIIKDGKVDKIVVIKSGANYCPNKSSDDDIITDPPFATTTGIFVDKPGVAYTSGDTITITFDPIIDPFDDDQPDGEGIVPPGIVPPTAPGTGPGTGTGTGTGIGVTIPLVITPNGSIIDVVFPNNFGDFSHNSTPFITINTQTGRGASLIPITEFKETFKDDRGIDRSGLVGITSVIDCI